MTKSHLTERKKEKLALPKWEKLLKSQSTVDRNIKYYDETGLVLLSFFTCSSHTSSQSGQWTADHWPLCELEKLPVQGVLYMFWQYFDLPNPNYTLGSVHSVADGLINRQLPRFTPLSSFSFMCMWIVKITGTKIEEVVLLWSLLRWIENLNLEPYRHIMSPYCTGGRGGEGRMGAFQKSFLSA